MNHTNHVSALKMHNYVDVLNSIICAVIGYNILFTQLYNLGGVKYWIYSSKYAVPTRQIKL